jgi:hypothetical protein
LLVNKAQRPQGLTLAIGWYQKYVEAGFASSRLSER